MGSGQFACCPPNSTRRPTRSTSRSNRAGSSREWMKMSKGSPSTLKRPNPFYVRLPEVSEPGTETSTIVNRMLKLWLGPLLVFRSISTSQCLLKSLRLSRPPSKSGERRKASLTKVSGLLLASITISGLKLEVRHLDRIQAMCLEMVPECATRQKSDLLFLEWIHSFHQFEKDDCRSLHK